jgi:hypothetical protein
MRLRCELRGLVGPEARYPSSVRKLR